MAVEERSSDPAYVLGQKRPNERGEVDRTIKFWQQNLSKADNPPLLAKFDFSGMKGDWGHRFEFGLTDDLLLAIEPERLQVYRTRNPPDENLL